MCKKSFFTDPGKRFYKEEGFRPRSNSQTRSSYNILDHEAAPYVPKQP